MNINIKSIKSFIDDHDFEVVSAADIEYSLHTNPEVIQEMKKLMQDISDESEQEKLLREKIEECNRPDELVNYMRKPMNMGIRELLIGKLLEMEDEVIPLIKQKCLRNSFEIFIENAVRFLIVSKENCTEWIIENYFEIRSEYLKSMLCLVIGFRGNIEAIPFLIQQAERYEKNYLDENYERGPVLAVTELYYRHIKR